MHESSFKNLAITPHHCHLWTQDSPQPELTVMKQYPEDGYISRADESSRSLRKCIKCGQLYFYEMAELRDMEDGDDPVFRIYIPVASEKDADTLATLPDYELPMHTPHINFSWPKGGEKTITWIRA